METRQRVHLKEHHKVQGYRCPLCGTLFPTLEDSEGHAGSGTCQSQMLDPDDDRIDDGIYRRLKDKSERSGEDERSVESRWHGAWKIIFPLDQNIPDHRMCSPWLWTVTRAD
jgi:hypothetical protein